MTDQQETQQENMFEEPADTLPSYEEEAAYATEDEDATEFIAAAESSVDAESSAAAEASFAAESSVESMQAYVPDNALEASAEPETAGPVEEAAAPAANEAEPVAAPFPILTADDFAALEERVLRAVSLVRREREARMAAEERAVALEGRVAGLQLEVATGQRMHEEIEALRTEREQVRLRVERLLVQLDALDF